MQKHTQISANKTKLTHIKEDKPSEMQKETLMIKDLK